MSNPSVFRHYSVWLILQTLLLTVWGAFVAAAPMNVAASPSLSTEGYLRYLEDPSNVLDRDSLPSLDGEKWQVSEKATPNFGYSKSTWWFALPSSMKAISESSALSKSAIRPSTKSILIGVWKARRLNCA